MTHTTRTVAAGLSVIIALLTVTSEGLGSLTLWVAMLSGAAVGAGAAASAATVKISGAAIASGVRARIVNLRAKSSHGVNAQSMAEMGRPRNLCPWSCNKKAINWGHKTYPRREIYVYT